MMPQDSLTAEKVMTMDILVSSLQMRYNFELTGECTCSPAQAGQIDSANVTIEKMRLCCRIHDLIQQFSKKD